MTGFPPNWRNPSWSLTLKATIGPGDACQNIFGQLSFGLNHASFCLMSAPLPVRVQAYRGDLVFPFEGTRHTVELVEGVMKRLGWGERFGMTDMEGGSNSNFF